MEIRANYIMVGAFALASMVLAVVYAIWTAKTANKHPMMEYEILYDGSVSGLSINSDVLFSGIKVGSVKSINLSPNDVGKVETLIEIRKDVPVRTDSIASLELQGVTGQAAVIISSGTQKAPLLKDSTKATLPIIHSQQSRLQQVVTTLPQVLAEAKEVLHRANDVLDDRNRKSLKDLLENLDTISKEASENSVKFGELVTNANKALVSANGMITELRTTVRTANDFFAEAKVTLKTSGPGISKFSNEGLDDFRRLLTDARYLVNNLNRVSQKLDNDPRRFLFGTQFPEYNGPAPTAK